jgi:peptidoglycan/LPS O-acetylase OafA/YrhL
VPLAVRAPVVSSTAHRPQSDVRTDIQGLRAIAVSAVLVYHLWPHRLTGGFVGVDVFFVISGFLITSHLLVHPPDRARNLLDFWSRRIRRLLPAALLVLLATLIASRLVAPDTRWSNTAEQVRSAALYVVNWRLASDSTDYLAADSAPSPVQHFWSLSVEEQFYLFWPVLILLLVLLARGLRARVQPIVTLGLTAAVVASLAYSIHATDTEPARAYFVTTTRVWELGIGGVLAALLSRRAFGRARDSEAVPLPIPARALLAWLGLATIAVAVFTYSGSTPFPGWQALLPTLGTALVIAAGPPITFGSPGRLLAVRPMQWLGDVSYSVYLWHWPLIVLVPFVSGDHLGFLDKVAIIVCSLVLAALTKRLVEDPFRRPRWGRPLAKPFALAAVGMAVVIGATAMQLSEVQHREQQAQTALARALAGHDKCFGAAALAAPAGTCPPPQKSGTLIPDPIQAAHDQSNAYADGPSKKSCFANQPSFPDTVCTFGDPQGSVRVALVGNSHAGEWVSTLEALARTNKWRLTTYLASRCAFADVAQQFAAAGESQACLDWVHRTTRTVAARHYDLVVMTNRLSVVAEGTDLHGSQPLYEKGYRAVLAAMSAAHEPVVGIRDTPAPGQSVPDCLAAHPDDYLACDGTRRDWLPPEPLTQAIAAIGDPRVTEADLTDYICEPVRCSAVIGSVPVYFDGSHLTATFAQTLAPYLEPYLERALAS